MPASRARRTPFGSVPFVLAGLVLAALPVTPSPARAQTASVTLLWTAPGDDGMTGRASRYDLRISTNPIAGTDTLSWWNAATVVDMSGRVPAPAGAADSVAVSNLTAGTQYYAVLRAGDEVPNWSGYSNVALIDLRDSIPPSPVVDLRVRF
jgi:hypothetical protein